MQMKLYEFTAYLLISMNTRIRVADLASLQYN